MFCQHNWIIYEHSVSTAAYGPRHLLLVFWYGSYHKKSKLNDLI